MTDTQKRLAGKIAVIVGAGQQPGGTPGNGRATAVRHERTCLDAILSTGAAPAGCTTDQLR